MLPVTSSFQEGVLQVSAVRLVLPLCEACAASVEPRQAEGRSMGW